MQSTDFWVSESASCRYVPCLSFFPLLIIDIVNLISDFDTAPPGTPESNTILTMSSSTFQSPESATKTHVRSSTALQPATIGSCMRNSIRLPPRRIETKISLPHINCSPLYAVSTWKVQEDILPMWTAPIGGANIQTNACWRL